MATHNLSAAVLLYRLWQLRHIASLFAHLYPCSITGPSTLRSFAAWSCSYRRRPNSFYSLRVFNQSWLILPRIDHFALYLAKISSTAVVFVNVLGGLACVRWFLLRVKGEGRDGSTCRVWNLNFEKHFNKKQVERAHCMNDYHVSNISKHSYRLESYCHRIVIPRLMIWSHRAFCLYWCSACVPTSKFFNRSCFHYVD